MLPNLESQKPIYSYVKVVFMSTTTTALYLRPARIEGDTGLIGNHLFLFKIIDLAWPLTIKSWQFTCPVSPEND